MMVTLLTYHPTDTDTYTFTSRPSRETRRKAPRVAGIHMTSTREHGKWWQQQAF